MATKNIDQSQLEQLPLGDKERDSTPPPAPAQDNMATADATPLPSPAPMVLASDEEVARAADSPGGTIAAFSSQNAFVAAQRMAKALASSSLVPKEYQNNVANCLIAMELASRIGVSVFAAMQSLDIIHGRPSWRAQFLIATVNSSGNFSPIRFRWVGKEGEDSWGCRAVAKDRESGEECLGAAITIGLAKAEGWYSRNGTKWKTMPEQMLMYRAASFWTRVYAPEKSLGMVTAEEVIDTHGETLSDMPSSLKPGNASALESALRGRDTVPVS